MISSAAMPASGQPGHVAHHVAARALGREPDRIQRIHHLGQRLDRQPVKLDVLPRGDVGQVACIFARDAADGAQLVRRNDPVGDSDAHHEVFRCQPLAALAAGRADAVALGVNAPPFEIGRSPLRHHAGAALARKRAHLVERFPRVLLALQAFLALRFGFFFRNRLEPFFPLPCDRDCRI